MIRSLRASASLTHFSASPISATASSIGSTRAGAPPCNGPDSAPTADESAAPASAPVEATMRAVRVDRLRVSLVHLSAPGEQEALGGGLALHDLLLPDGRLVRTAGGLRDDRE